MFSTITHRKSEKIPSNADPVQRLMYAVATRAVLDVMKRDTPSKHRRTALVFISENYDLLLSAGIPARKINMLLQQNGSGAATPDPAGASR